MDVNQVADLVTQAKKGDNAAREKIYASFKPIVYKIANSFYLVGGNVEDLAQEGMIGLFEAVADYDQDKGNFFAFCQLCIKRKIMTAVTKNNREKNLPMLNSVNIDEQFDLSDESADPLEILVGRDLLHALQDYIAEKLTPTEQDVLHYYTKGYSYTEIATILDKSAKSVDTALQRARKKLGEFKE